MPMPRIEHVEDLDPDGAGLQLPGHHRRLLRRRRAWERRPVTVGAKVDEADAGLHQARPGRGRRGAGPARRDPTHDPAPAGPRRARAVGAGPPRDRPAAWAPADIAAVRAERPCGRGAGPREDVDRVKDVDADGVPLPALPCRRAPTADRWCTCTAAASSSTTSTCTTARPAGSRTGPAGGARASTTGGRPSTGSRPPPTTSTPRSAGCPRGRRPRRRPGPDVRHGDSAGGNLALVAALRNPGGSPALRADLPVPRPDRGAARPTPRRDGGFDPRRGGVVLAAVRRARPPTCADPDLAPLLLATGSARCRRRWSSTAEHDPLRDEGEQLAARLAEEGAGRRHTYLGHGPRLLAAARALRRRRGAATRQIAGFLPTGTRLRDSPHARSPRLRPCRPRAQGAPPQLARRPRPRGGRPRAVRLRRPGRLPGVLPAGGRRASPPTGGGAAASASSSAAPATASRSPPTRSPGVRAALVWSEETAVLAREHNDANVISVGGRMHTVEDMTRFVEVFLDTAVHRRGAARPAHRDARRLRDDRRPAAAARSARRRPDRHADA